MTKAPTFLLLLLFICCNQKGEGRHIDFINDHPKPVETIAAIPVPEDYKRVSHSRQSFAAWLGSLALRKDNHVYLYNGSLKQDQSSHFAVLDMPVGKKDLQQCADALMRLRAEYLYSHKRYNEIVFRDNNNKSYKWAKGDDRKEFNAYLEHVFAMCGTASLEKQLTPVAMNEAMPGDVFIKGGFPGHAMMIANVAINEKGEKIFLLLQGFMPAQDIHIVKNPLGEKLSPWYDSKEDKITTPGWVFGRGELRRWPPSESPPQGEIWEHSD